MYLLKQKHIGKNVLKYLKESRLFYEIENICGNCRWI